MQFDVKIDVDLALAGILEESVAKFEEQLKEVVEYLGTETVKKWTENADIALKNPGNYRQLSSVEKSFLTKLMAGPSS